MNKGIAPMGQHDKPPPHQWDTGQRLLGPGARFAVAGGHAMGSRMGSSKSPCRTSYLSSIETINTKNLRRFITVKAHCS